MSLKDIAKRSGFDVSTVSRALNDDNRKPAKAETRDLIRKIAKEMDYRPNSVARSLRTRRTEAIGLVWPDASNPGFANIFRGVQRAAAHAGWHVIVMEGGHSGEGVPGWDRLILEGRVDGVLVGVASMRDPVVRGVARSGLPIVLLNRRASGVVGSVVMKDERGAEIAVDHFVTLGHRKIAHVAGPASFDTSRRRSRGFNRAMRRHQIPVKAAWVAETDSVFSEEGGAVAARQIIAASKGDLPTAVYVSSFTSALGVIRAFKDIRLRVPEDISIVVSEDLSLANYIDPPLTAVSMPVTQMGEAATNMLLGAVGGESVSDLTLPDDPVLIIRKSTAPPRKR